MSFEAAVASARGNNSVFAKSFVIATEGDALAWYSMLKPSTIYSWENLWDKILKNFKGFSSKSLTSIDLFQCKQSQGEPLKDYFQRYVQLKARAPNVSDNIAIEAAIKGLRIEPFAAHLAREKPATMQQLYSEFKKYYKSDDDYRKRLEEQNQGRLHGGRNGQRNGMDKANSSRGRGRTSKCSTSNTKSPTSKASLPHSLEDKPHLRDSANVRAMTKVEPRTRTQDRGSGSSTIFPWEREGARHQGLPRCQRNLRKNQE
jgi:hypothetical protein